MKTETAKAKFKKELEALCNKYNIAGRFEGHYFYTHNSYWNASLITFQIHPRTSTFTLTRNLLKTGSISKKE